MVNLSENDPIKLVYIEVGKYPFETNWANERGEEKSSMPVKFQITLHCFLSFPPIF